MDCQNSRQLLGLCIFLSSTPLLTNVISQFMLPKGLVCFSSSCSSCKSNSRYTISCLMLESTKPLKSTLSPWGIQKSSKPPPDTRRKSRQLRFLRKVGTFKATSLPQQPKIQLIGWLSWFIVLKAMMAKMNVPTPLADMIKPPIRLLLWGKYWQQCPIGQMYRTPTTIPGARPKMTEKVEKLSVQEDIQRKAERAAPQTTQTNLGLDLLYSLPAIVIDIACPSSESGNTILVLSYVIYLFVPTILKYEVTYTEIIPHKYMRPIPMAIMNPPITLKNALHLQFDPISTKVQIIIILIHSTRSNHIRLDSQQFNLKVTINRDMTFESQQHEHQLQEIIKFSSTFTFETSEQSLVLSSRCKSYLLKDMLVTNEDESELPTILDTLSLHHNLSPKYLLTLLHHEMYDRYDGNQYIKAIYEYGKLTLRQQIENRASLSSRFEEDELWTIFTMLVKALDHLEEQGIVYGVLGADKVFVGEGVKLLDPSATATDPLLISPGRLYSPQIVNDKEDINMFKSDVYVLGLMLLECGLLTDLSKEIECDLSEGLQTFNELYSKQLVGLVESMLSLDPQSRPSFNSLKGHLIQELEMNTTQANQSCEPCLPDHENSPTLACAIEQDQESATDVLYESPCGGRNLRDSQSQCDESECINTECQNASERYLAVNEIRHVGADHKKTRSSVSPLSALKSSRVGKMSNSKSKPHTKKQQQSIFASICNQIVHNPDSQSTASNTSKKQRTKQIKERVVKNIDLIREEDTEDENCYQFSKYPHHRHNTSQSRYWQTTNHDLISTKRNSEHPGNQNHNVYNHNEPPRDKQIQELSRSRPLYSSAQQNKLFTDPMLLRTIQDDLARIQSGKSSSLASRESDRFAQR